MSTTASVQRQYERFPYPPIPWMALPRGPAPRLSLEHGHRLLGLTTPLPTAPRILVAGSGTLEALVCARSNPRAAEIIAVDVSRASLRRLGRRVRFHRFARPWRRLPPIQLLATDVMKWESPGSFDLILASNFLHHLPDPAAGLARLAGWLEPQGLLRVVTYPRASRALMRWTARYLRSCGLHPATPDLRAKAQAAVARLPDAHPVRECYEHHPENGTRAGVVDAFFHALENPLSPHAWARACAAAGLQLGAEDQDAAYRSESLERWLPATAPLDAWTKLEILDSALALHVNPVWWLRKGVTPPLPPENARACPAPHWEPALDPEFADELSAAWTRLDALLASTGESAAGFVAALARAPGFFSLARFVRA